MAEDFVHAPQILSVEWGSVHAEGTSVPYKDAKLFPGGSRSWDWNETGTRHDPSIQPEDVQELLNRGARAVVLSRGFRNRLQTMPETRRLLEKHNIDCYILETGQAVEKYNELCTIMPVGGLIHSTC